MLRLFLLGLVFLQAGISYAYEPEKGHKPIVKTALKVYSQCFEDQSLYGGADARARVVQGDVSMDEGLKASLIEKSSLKGERVFSIVIRPFNWHFYNPDRAAYSRVGLVEQSHIRLWDDLEKGFYENKKEFNKLLFVGGIIHLVEDLTVPAHAVPVYHGPTAIEYIGLDSFKPLVSYMQEKGSEYSKSIVDKIDVIPPDVERLEKDLLNNKDVCAKAMAESGSLEDIRSSTVRFTLDYLQNEIPNCPRVKWQDFWVKPTGDEFFGRYNIKNDNSLFGEAGVLTSASGETCRFDAIDGRYSDFVFDLHKKAVESDLKVLYWANKNIERQ